MKRWCTIVFILLLICTIAIAEDGVASYTVTEQADGMHVVVASKQVSVRSEPSTRSKRLCYAKSDVVMEITEELDDWYGVITPEGDYGYVRKGYVVKDYMYVVFLRPTHIRVLPFENVPDCISPESAMNNTFLVIGSYGEWLKVKMENGIGYVRNTNNYPAYFQEDYSIFNEEFYITSYGTVYLTTDPYISANEDAARIGERISECFTVIGYWDNFWLIKYGKGVALVDMESPIITQMEVEYYYSKTPKYAITAWDTETGGRNGAGSLGTIPGGTTVEVLAIDEPWYIIKYEYKGIPTIAWISMYDTDGIIEE